MSGNDDDDDNSVVPLLGIGVPFKTKDRAERRDDNEKRE